MRYRLGSGNGYAFYFVLGLSGRCGKAHGEKSVHRGLQGRCPFLSRCSLLLRLMMTPERWQKVTELFESALERERCGRPSLFSEPQRTRPVLLPTT
jgi:hypothetical protein